MSTSLTSAGAESRRVFLSVEDEVFQLFSISQNANDGSIYFSAPKFEDIDWLVPSVSANEPPILLSYKSDGPGKLSLHGSGLTHVRPFDAPSPQKFAIRGNMLKSTDGALLGVRHLLTLFTSKPTHRPNSPAMARKTDYVITSKELHPYVIVFWAIPSIKPLTITVNGSFQADELQEIPPNGGWGIFGLRLHSIVWFAYRTRHMEKWPLHAQACYQDGLNVPLLIGTGDGTFRLELRQPAISLHDSVLNIAI